MFNRKKNQKNVIVFVSPTYKYLSVAYEEESELKVRTGEFDIQSNIDVLIKIWEKSIKKLLSKVKFKPYLVLLLNSSSFMVKNVPDIENENVRHDYISKQLDMPIGLFDITKIQDSSYLVVENSIIEKILFAFKDYNIKAFHDVSIINSLYFLMKKSELYINISLDNICIIHKDLTFQKRIADKLFFKYLQRSAEKLNLDLDSTYTHIKNNFSKIKSYQELMKSTQSGAVDLRGFIDDLVVYIKDTLQYFDNYNEIEYINTIYLDGDILELDFLINMLSEKLLLDKIIPINVFLNLNDHKRIASTLAYRVDHAILESSSLKLEGLRYNDGKQEYIFIDNSLISEKRLSKEQKRRVLSFQKIVEVEEETTSQRKKRPNKSIWQMNTTELIELFKDKFFSKQQERSQELQNKDKEQNEDKETGKIIFLIFLVLGASIYYVWFFILDLELEFDRKVNTYVNNVEHVNKAKEKLASQHSVFIDDGINKILWTEKFITIAKSMPDEVWFSSIRLESTEKEIEGKKVTSTRVVLNGRCLPSSIGHINTIATYMERLMESDSNFKKDFIDISFGGAESIFDEYNRDLISFKLYCNFRKNANIKEIVQENVVKKKSIVENLKSIKENAKKKKEILDNTIKGGK